MSSGNVNKYEFLTSKYVLPEKYLVEKAASLKRLEYSLLGKELKSQISFIKKRYQGLNNLFKSDEKKN